MPTVMAINEAYSGRHGEENDAGGRDLVRIFRVQFDTIEVGYSYALYAPGIPLRFAAYEGPLESDPGCRAVRRVADQDSDDPFWWTVTIYYSSISQNPALTQQGGGGGGSPTNEVPTLDPPEIQWGASHDSVVQQKDWDDKAICTSASEPFDPAPKVDFHRPSLTYARNEAEYDLSDLQTYWDTVNQLSFHGFPPRSVKLNYTTANMQYRNNLEYYRVTYFFEFRLPDWDHHLADRGTMVLDEQGNPQRVIRTGSASGKVFLFGDGFEMSPDELSVNGPTILDFKAYAESDFDNLDITGL